MNDETKEELLSLVHTVMTTKSQPARVLDFVFIGPILLIAANNASKGLKLTKPMTRVIRMVGWGTIIYNLYNFMKVARAKKQILALTPELDLNFVNPGLDLALA